MCVCVRARACVCASVSACVRVFVPAYVHECFVRVSLHVLLQPFCMSVCYVCEDNIPSDDVLINSDCTTAYVALVVFGVREFHNRRVLEIRAFNRVEWRGSAEQNANMA